MLLRNSSPEICFSSTLRIDVVDGLFVLCILIVECCGVGLGQVNPVEHEVPPRISTCADIVDGRDSRETHPSPRFSRNQPLKIQYK